MAHGLQQDHQVQNLNVNSISQSKGSDADDAASKTEVFHKAMMEIIGE